MPYNRGMLLTHYTHKCNRPAIEGGGRILSALSLMELHGRMDLARERRKECEQIASGVMLRDQSVLRKSRVKECSMDFEDFVEYLNGHVFFWADTVKGEKARRGFRKKYPNDVGLRCRLDDLREANPDVKILFAPYNSAWEGRWFPFCRLTPDKEESAVEVNFPEKVRLPDNTQIECEGGNWRDFFCGDAA